MHGTSSYLHRLNWQSIAVLGVCGVLAAPLAAIAQTTAPLTVENASGDGFTRAVLSWADQGPSGVRTPAVRVSIDAQVAVLTFDQPVSLDIDRLRVALGLGQNPARLSPDGLTLRLALGRDSQIRVTRSADRTAIDLFPAGQAVPATYVSATAREEATEKAEAERIAALPPPPPPKSGVAARLIEMDGRTRVSLLWPQNVTYTLNQSTPETVVLTFNRPADADIVRIKTAGSKRVKDATALAGERNWTLTLAHEAGLKVTHFQEEGAVQIDFSDPVAPELKPSNPTSGPRQLAPAPTPEPVRAASDDASKPAAPPTPQRRLTAPTAAEIAKPKAEAAKSRFVELERVAIGTLRSEGSTNGTNAVLNFPFRQPVAASVFRRDDQAWIVFAASGSFDLAPLVRTHPKLKITSVPVTGGLGLKLNVPEGHLVSALAIGSVWSVRVGPEGEAPKSYLTPTRQGGRGGGARLELPVPGLARLASLEDANRGDTISVALAMAPVSALAEARRFVEGEFLQSAQGAAFAARADDLTTALEDGRLVITAAGGMALSNTPTASANLPPALLTPGFMNFDTWALGPEKEIWNWRRRLEDEAAMAEPGRRSEALMRLARFFLAHDLAAEALGTLKVAIADTPALENRSDIISLRVVANTMMGRFDEAREDLRGNSLSEDAGLAPWIGLIATERGDWEGAADAFERGRSTIPVMTDRWSARFSAAAAKTALNLGDAKTSTAFVTLAEQKADAQLRPALELAKAKLLLAESEDGAALAAFTELAKTAPEPVSIEAELSRVQLALKVKEISRGEAINALEALRFRWRGDALELIITEVSTRLMVEDGRAREALQIAKAAGLRGGELPPARRMRVRLIDDFTTLFLDGGADRLDPIQALALYYEFKDLTPIGTDGDRMIRRLANRLVAFDLLAPAAELLTHQVENRLRGRPQAEVGSDLAAIYLMDAKPELALQALAASRQPQLDEPLRRARRLLEAAAYMGQGRYGLALELLEALEGQDVEELRAEIAWRAKDWTMAADHLQAVLPAPGASFDLAAREKAVRAAIALRFAGDTAGLRTLRQAYSGRMAAGRHAESFAFLTSENELSGPDLADAARRLADLSTVDAFAGALKARFATEPEAAPDSTKPS